mmetsp:Transcript_64338/g.178799  ORF Transcript_64338/g.178799 Transcript_64338/m.178799 type:complete len:525 (+) Transcript_64338:389-1963(+)
MQLSSSAASPARPQASSSSSRTITCRRPPFASLPVLTVAVVAPASATPAPLASETTADASPRSNSVLSSDALVQVWTEAPSSSAIFGSRPSLPSAEGEISMSWPASRGGGREGAPMQYRSSSCRAFERKQSKSHCTVTIVFCFLVALSRSFLSSRAGTAQTRCVKSPTRPSIFATLAPSTVAHSCKYARCAWPSFVTSSAVSLTTQSAISRIGSGPGPGSKCGYVVRECRTPSWTQARTQYCVASGNAVAKGGGPKFRHTRTSTCASKAPSAVPSPCNAVPPWLEIISARDVASASPPGQPTRPRAMPANTPPSAIDNVRTTPGTALSGPGWGWGCTCGCAVLPTAGPTPAAEKGPTTNGNGPAWEAAGTMANVGCIGATDAAARAVSRVGLNTTLGFGCKCSETLRPSCTQDSSQERSMNEMRSSSTTMETCTNPLQADTSNNTWVMAWSCGSKVVNAPHLHASAFAASRTCAEGRYKRQSTQPSNERPQSPSKTPSSERMSGPAATAATCNSEGADGTGGAD